MLKIRIIPILTFNGFALVATKKFNNPRMIGNPVQSAKVFDQDVLMNLFFLILMLLKITIKSIMIWLKKLLMNVLCLFQLVKRINIR